jgi:hypothetical protein
MRKLEQVSDIACETSNNMKVAPNTARKASGRPHRPAIQRAKPQPKAVMIAAVAQYGYRTERLDAELLLQSAKVGVGWSPQYKVGEAPLPST